MAARLLKRVNDFQNAVAFSGSQIVNGNAFFVCQFLDRFHMAACQIHDMDVITHTGSVRSVIIVSEYSDAVQFTDRHLRNVWKQVVRDSFRILSDQSALMCSDRVEVTKQDHVPFRICRMDICQHLLQHALGPSVWIGRCSLRAFLGDRNLCRIPVYRCGRTEDNVLHTVISHLITENQGSCHIVHIIFNRLANGFAHRFQTCKVDDGIDVFLIENFLHAFAVQHVSLVKGHFLSCNLFHAVQSLFTGIVEIVHDNNIISLVQQFHTGMASDISGAAGN